MSDKFNGNAALLESLQSVFEADTSLGKVSMIRAPMEKVLPVLLHFTNADAEQPDLDETIVSQMMEMLGASIGFNPDEAWGLFLATGGFNGPLMQKCLEVNNIVGQNAEQAEDVAQAQAPFDG